MNIHDIRFPDFEESWKEYTARCPKENPYHFVLIGNSVLAQYVDGYLYPIPFNYTEDNFLYKENVCDKVKYLKSKLKVYSEGECEEINNRMSENYPPYCTLFTTPSNKRLLTIIFRVKDFCLTDMTAVGYCEDYDCFVGGIRIPYGHGEDERVYLLSKDIGLITKEEKDYKKVESLIRDNGIFVGTEFDGINANDGRLCKGMRVRMINMDRKPYKTVSCIYFSGDN